MSVIEFVNVSKEYIDGSRTFQALKETNFTIESGEFVAIIGPSGSGKSTFLGLAGGLETPTMGKVLINGQPFSDEKEKKRAQLRFKEIGFILQASNLINYLTVKDQLRLVDKINKQANDSGLNLLQELGVGDLADKYPEDLSGGERQRVAIARAFYNNPSIILADEPTASLDSSRAREVVEILARETRNKNKATIMVTHDTGLIDVCDKVYLMKDGQLELEK